MKRVILLLSVFCFLVTSEARSLEFCSDLILAGNAEKIGSWDIDSGLSLRSHTTLFVDSSDFTYGPTLQFEWPSSGTSEFVFGIGARYGKKYFLEIDGGFLWRNFSGYSETGIGLIFVPGTKVNLFEDVFFRLTLPVVFKIVTSGLSSKIIVDYIPYLGISLDLG